MIYPFYHVISDKEPVHIKNLYKVKTSKQFRKDLDFLTKYYIPSLEIELKLKSEENLFHLSFDDGLKECYTIIAPILKEYNIKASFFINSAFVDNKNLFFRYKESVIINKIKTKKLDKAKAEQIIKLLNINNKVEFNKIEKAILNIKYKDKYLLNQIAKIINLDFEDYLKNNEPYLTSFQIQELINEGHQIGSHSINHPLFSEINEEEQILQTSECMKFITDNFNVKNKLFAFPFSDNDIKKSFFNKVYSKNIIDYSFGTAGIKKDIISNNIQRIPLEKRNISAEKYIKTEYLLYFLKKLLLKNKIYRN